MVGLRWALRRIGQQGILNSRRELSKRESLESKLQLVAREYSSKHRTMWTNVNCKVRTRHVTAASVATVDTSGDEMINNLVIKGDNFPGGITNGAQWYDVPGGMQVGSGLRLNMNIFLISIMVIMFRILTTCTATRLRSRWS